MPYAMIALDPYNTGDRIFKWATESKELSFDQEIISQYQNYHTQIKDLLDGDYEMQLQAEDMEMAAADFLYSLVRKKYPELVLHGFDSVVLCQIPDDSSYEILHARNGNEECLIVCGEKRSLAKILPW